MSTKPKKTVVMNAYPEHAYQNARAFKAKKRADLRVAILAVNELRMGCAYVPEGEKVVEAVQGLLDQLRDAMSAKKWGR